MRILQLIDSLDNGGAEMMAVNYANALNSVIDFSGIIATRREGQLKNKIENQSSYLFLNRKSIIDIAAILRLKSYIKLNKIEYIHAHGTSFFIAILTKMICSNIKIVWHDHSGNRATQSSDENKLLRFCSRFFFGSIVVNHNLEDWCNQHLLVKKVLYLPNFTRFSPLEQKQTILKGVEGKRILCLANLRAPKNHQLLLEVAKHIGIKHPEWTFHFVGNDLNDDYSHKLKEGIAQYLLTDKVYIYGLKQDTENIINQSDIAVLSSISEGLPVALLEYGMMGKAVVATAVGEIPLIIINNVNGFVVPSNEASIFASALMKFIENNDLRAQMGKALYETVNLNHSQEVIVNQYLDWLVNK